MLLQVKNTQRQQHVIEFHIRVSFAVATLSIFVKYQKSWIMNNKNKSIKSINENPYKEFRPIKWFLLYCSPFRLTIKKFIFSLKPFRIISFFFLVKYKTALRRAIRKLKQYSLVHSKALQNTFPEMKCTHEMETSLKDNI